MPRLKNRQLQIPNGLQFYIPHIKWSPPPYMSLDSIARSAISVLQANPNVAAKLGWDLSIPGMSDRIDEFNALICLQRGHPQYVLAEGGQPDTVPFRGFRGQSLPGQSNPSVLAAAASSVKAIWSGIKTISEWIDAGAPSVAPEKSAARAGVCIVCQKHGEGDFTSWFTKPAAEAIRRQVERAKSLNLSTPHDEQLNVCQACWCPMKLKVHMPIEIIRNGTSEDIMKELRQGRDCWIMRELAGS